MRGARPVIVGAKTGPDLREILHNVFPMTHHVECVGLLVRV